MPDRSPVRVNGGVITPGDEIPNKGFLVAVLDGMSGGRGAEVAGAAKSAIRVKWSQLDDRQVLDNPIGALYD